MKNGLAVLMLVFGLALHGHAADVSHTQDTAQVVFICEHGSAKSVIAAAYFNKIAQQRGLALREWNSIAPVSSGYALSRDGMVKEITALKDQLAAGEK